MAALQIEEPFASLSENFSSHIISFIIIILQQLPQTKVHDFWTWVCGFKGLNGEASFYLDYNYITLFVPCQHLYSVWQQTCLLTDVVPLSDTPLGYQRQAG
jgi:hypothetical protein